MLNEPTGKGDGYLWALSGEVLSERVASYGWVHKVSPLLGADRGIGMERKNRVVFSESSEETCNF